MAPTAAQALALFASQIGEGEHPPGSNHTKYGPAGSWCFYFLSWGFKELGALDLIHGSHGWVPDFRSIFEPHGEFHTSNPKAGDLVAFDFNGNGTPEHIGIVEKVISASTIQTIEGNTSDVVARRVRSRSYVYAYATPHYAAASAGGWPGRYLKYVHGQALMHGSDVTWVQKRVHVTADGYYGPVTAAAVKGFQHAHHLTEDGIVGPQTWKALAAA